MPPQRALILRLLVWALAILADEVRNLDREAGERLLGYPCSKLHRSIEVRQSCYSPRLPSRSPQWLKQSMQTEATTQQPFKQPVSKSTRRGKRDGMSGYLITGEEWETWPGWPKTTTSWRTASSFEPTAKSPQEAGRPDKLAASAVKREAEEAGERSGRARVGFGN
jgi:hypothetical protein